MSYIPSSRVPPTLPQGQSGRPQQSAYVNPRPQGVPASPFSGVGLPSNRPNDPRLAALARALSGPGQRPPHLRSIQQPGVRFSPQGLASSLPRPGPQPSPSVPQQRRQTREPAYAQYLPPRQQPPAVRRNNNGSSNNGSSNNGSSNNGSSNNNSSSTTSSNSEEPMRWSTSTIKSIITSQLGEAPLPLYLDPTTGFILIKDSVIPEDPITQASSFDELISIIHDNAENSNAVLRTQMGNRPRTTQEIRDALSVIANKWKVDPDQLTKKEDTLIKSQVDNIVEFCTLVYVHTIVKAKAGQLAWANSLIKLLANQPGARTELIKRINGSPRKYGNTPFPYTPARLYGFQGTYTFDKLRGARGGTRRQKVKNSKTRRRR